MFAKKNGRVSFRSNRRPNYKKNSGTYSNNRPRTKGNVSQLYEKYNKLGIEAASSGDRVQSEYYYQFADHYSRLMTELGIKSQESTLVYESKDEKDISVKTNDTIEKEESETENLDNNIENDDEINDESIETVSFIAKPAKKKSIKIKK